MRKLIPLAFFCLPLCSVGAFAQSRSEIDRAVYQRLRDIKPRDSGAAKYSIVLPKTETQLPADLRLDIVYKLGHYQWEIGALRFERSRNDEMIAITKLTHSSAFAFSREWDPGEDESVVGRATMPKADFARLLRTALRFYEADIVRRPAEFKACGSSGDGVFMFSLSGTGEGQDRLPADRKGDGQIVDDIPYRAACGYDEVRDTLFWEVFDGYLKANVVFFEMEKYRIEDLLIARLTDDPIADNYRDYFRRSLLVDLLGDFGTAKSIPVLARVGEAKLADNWRNSLREDAENSTRKIQQRARE